MAKVTYPETQEQKAKLYLHCMMEIKLRIDAINEILNSTAITLFKYETASLHLRHICELIAIGCLAAQGDYETQRAFKEEYSPPKIFNALRSIYPHFFPRTFEVEEGDDGVKGMIENTKPDAYTEKQVCEVWSKAGNILHRASVKKYLTTTFSPPPDLGECDRHLTGITHLMEQHMIPIDITHDNVTLLQVALDDGSGGPRAYFFHLDTDGTAVVDRFWTSLA